MPNNILVLGATGHVGGRLVAQLVAAKEQVKAASRHVSPVAGAEAVRFDYADRSTFAAAFEGVDRVFVMLPGGYTNPVGFLQPVIQAAAERKVKVVLQTAIGVDSDDTIPYRQVELFLMRSGTPFVILRPTGSPTTFTPTGSSASSKASSRFRRGRGSPASSTCGTLRPAPRPS